MKRIKSSIFAVITVLAIFAMGSCEGFAPTIKVPFKSEAEFNLTPITGKSVAEESLELLHEWSFNQDLNQLIQEYGGNPEKIKESNIKSVTLTLVGESDIDLTTVFTALKLYVDKIPAELEELVAQSSDITATSVTFELVKGNIFDYTSGSEGFTFFLYGDVTNDNIPTTGIELKVTVESELVVEIL
jgi:hypothetical protein